jgi:hypothetical protein
LSTVSARYAYASKTSVEEHPLNFALARNFGQLDFVGHFTAHHARGTMCSWF